MAAQIVEPAKKKIGLIWKILIVLAVIVIGILAVAAMQPSEYRVTRSATMSAPAPVVFEQVNDFHKWEAWSPWAKKDPNAKTSYDGPASGKGANFKWSGNQEVGEGAMTLTESRPHELIRIKLDFIKPFEDTANVEFNFKPQGDQTNVTWTMDGKNNFISKIICLFMNMDKMIGGDFEQGLASMKSVVEAAPKQ